MAEIVPIDELWLEFLASSSCYAWVVRVSHLVRRTWPVRQPGLAQSLKQELSTLTPSDKVVDVPDLKGVFLSVAIVYHTSSTDHAEVRNFATGDGWASIAVNCMLEGKV